MNKILSALVFILLSGCAGAAQAGSLVEVTVVDRTTGVELPRHRHRGQRYVAGNPGDRYAVRLRNKSAGRILAVLSVDGVNAVSGETAAVDQAGYVLDPYAVVEITGWRKSLNDVAAFVFTALPDSYAARTGRPDNVGVIGVAVFREKPVARVLPLSALPLGERARDEAGTTSGLASSAPRKENKLGTGHGGREHSPVIYTEFTRASSRPHETLSVFYDSRANLIAMGVLPRPTPCPPPTPCPFPATTQFVPDP